MMVCGWMDGYLSVEGGGWQEGNWGRGRGG